MSLLFANVVFPMPINKYFTYDVPDEFQHEISAGFRVLVKFGRRVITGFVVELIHQTDLSKLKPIEDLLDEKPVFSKEILKLTKWISSYYLCSWGEALNATLPAGMNVESKKIVEIIDYSNSIGKRTISSKQKLVLDLLKKTGALNFSKIEQELKLKSISYSIRQLEMSGFVKISQKIGRSVITTQYEKFIELTSQFRKRSSKLKPEVNFLRTSAPKQFKCLSYLTGKSEPVRQTELIKKTKAPISSIQALEHKGWIEIIEKEKFRDYYAEQNRHLPKLVQLTDEQKLVVKNLNTAIRSKKYHSVLLHGITGSGKTQVYIEAIREILKCQRTAIVLVPEISLTPQIVQRFKAVFPDQVAVLHSRMSVGERYDSWRQIKSEKKPIVVGPRSAIFAPLRNIGLIVVDEEHVQSYKQYEPAPRYHARDVAIMHAYLNNAVVVLGSATPSLESYYNALSGRYSLCQLNHRIDNLPLPKVNIVDMREEKNGTTQIFSRLLLYEMERVFNRGEQVILLQNRRGFATFIECRNCGYVVKCRLCDIPLTYHKEKHRFRCHYCGYSENELSKCPDCLTNRLRYSGIGTQRVESELKKHFPFIRMSRMDLDTTSGKYAHHQIISEFGEGKIDVLLGTQMVAKGLDFKGVTLVGVISADTSLFFPDFRASENTFDLLTQVAGRSGRSKKRGEVIIQTYSPTHPSLQYTKHHDFKGFYEYEISTRRELSYPPFSRLVRIEFRGHDEQLTYQFATEYTQMLNKMKGFDQLLGPSHCLIYKIRGYYYWQLILKSNRKIDPTGRKMKKPFHELERLMSNNPLNNKVRVIWDVDPY